MEWGAGVLTGMVSTGRLAKSLVQAKRTFTCPEVTSHICSYMDWPIKHLLTHRFGNHTSALLFPDRGWVFYLFRAGHNFIFCY